MLGPVLVDGRSPPGGIERALLARLLVEPGAPVPAEELIEAAWPNERRAGAAASLRVRLARLRAFLEPGRAPGTPAAVLVREPAGYRLLAEPGSVDAERFLAMAGETTLAGCEAALALWRGEPFADLDGVDVAAARARRLHAARDGLRRRHALALLDHGRVDEAVAELERLAAEDPVREEPVRDLMHACIAPGATWPRSRPTGGWPARSGSSASSPARSCASSRPSCCATSSATPRRTSAPA